MSRAGTQIPLLTIPPKRIIFHSVKAKALWIIVRSAFFLSQGRRYEDVSRDDRRFAGGQGSPVIDRQEYQQKKGKGYET